MGQEPNEVEAMIVVRLSERLSLARALPILFAMYRGKSRIAPLVSFKSREPSY